MIVHGVWPAVDRSSFLFTSSGWDSWSKIKILDDSFDCQAFYGNKHLALYAEAIESPTAVSSSMHSASVAVPVEDEQTFLERQAKLLQKAGAAMPLRETSNMNALAGTASSTSATSLLAASAASGTRRLSAVTSSADAAKNTSSGTAQNAVLANFFQSLLNKKGGTTPGVAASSATTTGATSLSTGGSGSTRVGAATSLASTTNRPVSRTAAAAELERLRAAAQRPSGV